MDTPEKPQMATSLSKFEDSPVFNYINSLSPIKPVKSIPITQIFNPPCFSSLPSVFTSPHVSSQSHKESRFLKRHYCSDLSNREIFSSETGDKVNTKEGVATAADQLYDIPATLPPDFDQGVPTEEANLDMSTEHSVFTIELPRTLKYDCGSPDCDSTPCGNESEFVGNSALVIEQATGNCLNVVGTCQTEQKNEATGCDWESMLMDAADLLFFNSPGDSEALKWLFKSPFQPCIQSIMIEVPRMHTGDPSGFSEQLETGDRSLQSGETLNQKQGSLATSNQNPLGRENDEDGTCIPFACQPESNLQRGFRRRCLDFEMAGGRRRNLNDGSNYNENIMSKDKLVVPTRPRSDSSRCILSGIGLHLNALAIASRDNKVLKNESIKPEQQNLPSSTVSFHSRRTCERSFSTASTEIGTEPGDNGVQLTEDSSQTALYLANEEFNQNSPKKKRRRTEQAGESESSCKRCNCKKSKCLKLYCECFAAGVYCVEPCACQECFNKPIHEETVLATRKQIESRNPLAFAPKVIRGLDSAPEIKDDYSKTPASARHKRGCNCKKSSCLKKYCECYQGGVGCSVNCRCEGCKNAFGRKDGECAKTIKRSVPTETEEEEEEEDETEKRDMVVVDKAVQKTEIPTKEPRNLTSAFPITPLQLSRPLIQLPFSSMNKHSPLATGSSSSMLYNGQKYGKPNIIRSQSKLEKHLQTVPEDEMPEILQKTRSPTTGVKSASPNSKRITPPHHDLATSPSLRSSRKLILQSIPSFPSLTPKH